MKTKIILTLLLSFACSFSFGQVTCPPGQVSQPAKWNFIYKQCFQQSMKLVYADTSKVAYVDTGGNLVTISWESLYNKLGISDSIALNSSDLQQVLNNGNTATADMIIDGTITSNKLQIETEGGSPFYIFGADDGSGNKGSIRISSQGTDTNSTEGRNTSLGYGSLAQNTTGGGNTAIGFKSNETNGTGSNNTSIGYNSLASNSTGGGNVGLGSGTGGAFNSNNSIFIGDAATSKDGSGYVNEIVIGAQAVGLGENTTLIGGSSTEYTEIKGKVKATGADVAGVSIEASGAVKGSPAAHLDEYVTLGQLQDSIDGDSRTTYGFTPKYPYLIDVWQNSGDTNYYTNFDWKQVDTAIKGDTLWFSPTGTDAPGRGTLALPLKSLTYAYTNYPNAKKYYLLAGMYKYENGFIGQTLSRDLSIKKYQNSSAKVILTNRIYPTITNHVGNVYKFRSTDTSLVMVDTSSKNMYGTYKPLYKIYKVMDSVIANPGTYFWQSDTIYFQRYSSTGPDSAFMVQANIATIKSDGYYKLHLQDIDVWGGNMAVSASNEDTLKQKYVTAVNCNFSYSASDIFHNAGNVFTAYNNCIATYGDDGFNYEEEDVISNSADGFEYKCKGLYNTSRIKSSLNPANSSNGSTSHRLGAILRVQGEYAYNQGPNVADINGCISVNIGCYAHNSFYSSWPTASTGIPIGFEMGTITSVGSTDRRVYASGVDGTIINCKSTDSIGLFVRNSITSVYNFDGDTLIPVIASTPPAQINFDIKERSGKSISSIYQQKYFHPVAFNGNYNDLNNLPNYDTGSFLQFSDTINKIATKQDVSNSGTVKQVSTGLGLSGGPITNTGTIIADTTILTSKAYSNNFLQLSRGYTAGRFLFGGTDTRLKETTNASYDSTTGNITTSGNFIAGTTNQFSFNGRSRITSATNGSLTFSNTAGTNFDRVNLGIANSSFPSIAVLGNGIGIRTGDGLLFSRLTVGGLRIDSIPANAAAFNSILTRDSLTGNVTKIPSNYYLSGYSGNYSTTAASDTSFTVTIGATMPNTSYKVLITATNSYTAAASSYYITNKTTTTFDIVGFAPMTGTVSWDWQVAR